MGVIPDIVSQLNLVRNGDFRHYVNTDTSPAPGATVWPPLIAHWELSLSATPLASTVTDQVVVGEQEPKRYLELQTGEILSQRIISTDVFQRPSVRENECSISSLGVGNQITVTATAPFFINDEPAPAPLSAISVSMNVGDLVQVANFTDSDGSGTYRVVSVTSDTVAILEPVTVPDPSVNAVGHVLNVIRTLDTHLIDLTLVYSIPSGQPDTAVTPSIELIRELPMAADAVGPITIAGGNTYDSVINPGGITKQMIHRFVIERPRKPRYINLKLRETGLGSIDIGDVGLFIGNYHMPVTTTFPVPSGTVQDAMPVPPDHLHLLTGRGDLILMRAGSQAPEGYKKLKEEIAFQNAVVTITYDAVSDLSEITVTDWQVPPDLLSGTFEIVFEDSPAAPGNPGPLDMSIRMSDVEFSDGRIGGAEIDLAGLTAGETVEIGYPPFPNTVTLTEGIDFTDAATLAAAINTDTNLSPVIVATAVGTVVEIRTVTAGWTNAQLVTEGYSVADTVTGADWEKIGGGALSPGGHLNIPTGNPTSALFNVRGDHSPRSGSSALVVATAPLLSNASSQAGDLEKPSKRGTDAVALAADQLELDTAGVELNDILTFTTEDGDPLAPSGGQGPTYQITSVNIEENEVVVQDITGGSTDVTVYATTVNNYYVIEKSSAKHSHYGSKADIDERELDSGGANSNTGRGNHGHEFYADDAIPPYRKFIICEKL